jgi:hypothetical protein
LKIVNLMSRENSTSVTRNNSAAQTLGYDRHCSFRDECRHQSHAQPAITGATARPRIWKLEIERASQRKSNMVHHVKTIPRFLGLPGSCPRGSGRSHWHEGTRFPGCLALIMDWGCQGMEIGRSEAARQVTGLPIRCRVTQLVAEITSPPKLNDSCLLQPQRLLRNFSYLP